MKRYKPGEEILPGVVYNQPVSGVPGGLRHDISITAGCGTLCLNTPELEALESIATELASLRARVPTEWRTGVPDWEKLTPLDVIQWGNYEFVGAQAVLVKHVDIDWHLWDQVQWGNYEFVGAQAVLVKHVDIDWHLWDQVQWGNYEFVGAQAVLVKHVDIDWHLWDQVQHRIIPYVAPPAPPKPKPLTVADLPSPALGLWDVFRDVNGQVYGLSIAWREELRYESVAVVPFANSEHAAVQAALDAIKEGKLDRWLTGGAE
jgi:hypothetical protein